MRQQSAAAGPGLPAGSDADPDAPRPLVSGPGTGPGAGPRSPRPGPGLQTVGVALGRGAIVHGGLLVIAAGAEDIGVGERDLVARFPILGLTDQIERLAEEVVRLRGVPLPFRHAGRGAQRAGIGPHG